MRRLSKTAVPSLANRFRVWWTPPGVYPRELDTRCACQHTFLVWFFADVADVNPACVVHGRAREAVRRRWALVRFALTIAAIVALIVRWVS